MFPLLYAVRYADWQVMSVVLQPLKIDLGLSDAQLGLDRLGVFHPGIITCYPAAAAHLVDVMWSRRKTLISLMARCVEHLHVGLRAGRWAD